MDPIIICLRLVPFLVLLLAPVFLTVRLRQRVLNAQNGGDEASGWFAFQSATHWISRVTWFAWVGGVLLLDPWWYLGAFFHWHPVLMSGFANLMTVIPPALVLATCEVLSFSVVKRVREVDVPFRETAVDAFMLRLWLTFPLALLWTGLRAKFGEDATLYHVLFLAGAAFSLLAFQVHSSLRAKKSTEFTPQAVTTGSLRDRGFALAAKAGVELNQIYVFPMARWRLANAYASEGNNLLLTDWLLRNLSSREVDAIIGHELAHMKNRHPAKLAWLLILLWGVLAGWFYWRGHFPEFAWLIFWILTSWHGVAWITTVVSRRYERQADVDGIAISQDPEAFISGLLLLEKLGL